MGTCVTAEETNLDEKSQRRESARQELARSLERELDLLAEERKERAQQLGLEPLMTPSSNAVAT